MVFWLLIISVSTGSAVFSPTPYPTPMSCEQAATHIATIQVITRCIPGERK